MQNVPLVQGRTTTQLFLEAAAQRATRIRWQVPSASSWRPVTWDEYCRQVSLITAALHSRGFVYDNKIGVLANNSIEWIYCALGIMTANCILVPIYAGNTPQQSVYIINHSDMRALFIENPATLNSIDLGSATSSQLKLVVLLTGNPDDCNSELPVITINEMYDRGRAVLDKTPGIIHDLATQPAMNDIAYMIYTSGTTGPPKGVHLSHRNLAASTGDWLQINGPLIPEKVVDIHWLPNSHIYGWGAIGLGNIFGFESYLGTPLNILDLLPELQPHIFLSVPAYYEKLYTIAINSSHTKDSQLTRLNELMGGRIKFLLSGGAGLKRNIKEFFLEAGLWITEGYGLSECSPTLTMNRRDAYRFDSVGLPFPSVELKLAEDGEILARGDNIFSGYYKNPQATLAAFTTDGWFKTGDVGRWLDGGFLKIIDRKQDIIVTTGGKNIAPQNIELKFNDDPFIEHLVVYGDRKKYLVALITLNELMIRHWAEQEEIDFSTWEDLAHSEEVGAKIKESIDRINSQLASYETIKYYYVTPEHFSPDNRLLTAALKVRRKEVHRRYEQQLEALYNHTTRRQKVYNE